MPKPTRRYVNIEGINNHVLEWCPIMMAEAVAHLNCGPVILIIHDFAHMAGKGHVYPFISSDGMVQG